MLEKKGLPKGWVRTTIDRISSKIHYGYTAKSTKEIIGPKYLRITDIQNDSVNWDDVPHCKIPSKRYQNFVLKSNDLVFARTGATVGKSFLLDKPHNSVFASYLIRIILSKQIHVRYVNYFFKSKLYWTQIHEGRVGMAQPNFNATKLSKIQVPLPPLAEQHRIVQKIESIFAQIDACVSRLERLIPQTSSVSGNLAQLKGSVLKQAFEGKLVSQDPNDEPAEELLRNLHKDKKLEFDKKGLPEGWIKIPLEFVTENFDKQRIPVSKSQRKKMQGSIPYYGASGIIDYVEKSIFHGDFVLIGEDGANLLARSTPIAFIARGDFWVNNHAHVLKTIGNIPLEFLADYINSIDLSPWVTGTAQPKLNQAKLKQIPIPIPPLNEQHRIVQKLESIFARIDAKHQEMEKLEIQLKSIPDSINMLKSSILKIAFEGRLVPQDPNDEPAEELLKKLQAKKSEYGKGQESGHVG